MSGAGAGSESLPGGLGACEEPTTGFAGGARGAGAGRRSRKGACRRRRGTRIGEDPLARVVFALLVLASFAAFGVTQRLKHTPTAVQGIKLSPSFSPGSAGAIGREHISFRIQHANRVTVAVIDLQGDTVRTLTRARQLQAYRRVFLEWNGLLRGGRTAPAGTYRIRVSLLNQQHQVLSPSSFELLASPAGGSGR